jgi:hypothetical protein
VTELPGASYFRHAESFSMMRGGHLEICVLGAYQVSATGDLAIGSRQTFAMMTLVTRDGSPKLVPQYTYPLTGLACVTRVYTDLAVFLIQPGGVVVRDLFGIAFGTLTTLLDVRLANGDQEGGLITPTSRIADSAARAVRTGVMAPGSPRDGWPAESPGCRDRGTAAAPRAARAAGRCCGRRGC